MSLTVIILTKNEERHIERALASVASIADRCLVVDSGSEDSTVEIASAQGAEVRINPFITQAQQFNWALNQLPEDTEWVLRLDADEIVTEPLATEIRKKLAGLPEETAGVYISRRMNFLGQKVRYGGLFPIRIIRLFRFGHGQCEDRWMDEHIVVDGPTVDFWGEIVDDNINSLTWWTQKHNAYASREVVDILNAELKFMPTNTIADLRGGQASIKRWVKERIYSRLPGGVRALLYFIYRFWFRLGFLDGKRGAIFHVLQGYWYRYLVDAKLFEVRRHMKMTGDSAEVAIKLVLDIDVSNSR